MLFIFAIVTQTRVVSVGVPFDLYTGKVPNFSQLRVFGSNVSHHVQKKQK